MQARDLAKRYGSRTALNRVDLSVRADRVHGLLGPNGAGKTTLLRILLGLVTPDAGTVTLHGRPLDRSLPRGRAGVAGFVESPRFYPYLTAARNLQLLAALDGLPAEVVEPALDRVGLTEHAGRKVRGFSTGMRQRLGLAAALIGGPAVIVVDEPTTGLDPLGIRELYAALTELAAQGTAVILSSHHLDEVEALCADVTVLRAGSVVYDGTLDALRHRAPERGWLLRTADDAAALAVSTGHSGVRAAAADGGGLAVRSEPVQLDPFVAALVGRGIAIRELRQDETPFQSLFFQLTSADADADAVADPVATPDGSR